MNKNIYFGSLFFIILGLLMLNNIIPTREYGLTGESSIGVGIFLLIYVIVFEPLLKKYVEQSEVITIKDVELDSSPPNEQHSYTCKIMSLISLLILALYFFNVILSDFIFISAIVIFSFCISVKQLRKD